MGNTLRARRGLQPPLGQYYVASFLQLLGATTFVFNLSLGENEYEEFEEAVAEYRDRLCFISFASNFLGPAELDASYYLGNIASQQDPGKRTRLVGGGMGVYFARNTYLRYTPLEIVIGRYGEPSFGDMLFGSSFMGTADVRDAIDIFGGIPNLSISVRKENEILIRETNVRPLQHVERRVLANSFDIKLMPLKEKYWSTGVVMGICAPDDLNIPLEFSGEDKASSDKHQRPEGRESLHIANYIFKPNTAKTMTTFGNCPRGCRFCQYTNFDEYLFHMTADEVVSQFSKIVERFPDVHMFVIDDDDFLIRKSHCRDLVARLRNNPATLGKIFYVETTPMEVEPEILQELREVGFRAILLGVESPVERIARHVGKLRPYQSFREYVNAPMRAYDEGFFTRVTCIPFYPIVSEPELLEVIEGLVRYVNYGIAVTVFPLIKVLPGTEFAQSDEYSILMSQYRLPKKEGFLNLRDYVLPSDTFVRKLALQSMKNTTKELRNIIVQHKIDGDYPSSLGVLAFFSSVISSWLNLGPRIVPRDKLEKMNLIVHDAINTLVRKSLVQKRVHELLRNPDTIKSRQDAAKLFTDEAALPFTIQALRHAIDFGDNHEVVAAAKLVNVLSKYGIGDKHLHESLRYALNRGLTSDQYSVVYSACNAS